MKLKSVYICSSCGSRSPKWLGKCNSCGEWNTFVEESEPSSGTKRKSIKEFNVPIQRLSEIQTGTNYRNKTGISEFDRVLGGGIVPGSLVLIGGDPGIGKSTLLLQMCAGIESLNALYITGEESAEQIKLRASRIKNINTDLEIMCETCIEYIDSAIKASHNNLIVVDSIQSVYSERVESTPGSVLQVRECASLLMQTAKKTKKPIFIVGHVTKEGVIAGPKVLEHTVDTVLQFEGEKTYSYRILRAVKNRYGSTNEIGIFEMTDVGLQEVKNPSEIFLAARHLSEPGVAIAAAMEGARPLLIEVQALVAPSGYAVPQRSATGFDYRRLQMLVAVLEKRLGIAFRQNDIFINIAGGITLNDTSMDLALAAAMVSSLKDMPIDPETAIIGEVGLTGEIRPVGNIEQRISEAEKLGFKRILIPAGNFKKINKQYKIKLEPLERISLALAKLF
ncbi:MAG: DNA repair protein RadA [Candidatus Kapabacteria bacterium]|nr:DNA repair protein RadA [Candidatus Kapabacteria bacterium]